MNDSFSLLESFLLNNDVLNLLGTYGACTTKVANEMECQDALTQVITNPILVTVGGIQLEDVKFDDATKCTADNIPTDLTVCNKCGDKFGFCKVSKSRYLLLL